MVRARAWAAFATPPLAWMVFEYGFGSALRPACRAVGTWLGPAWGGASLLACALAALLAWRSAADAEEGTVAVWLARVTMLGAGVFALAIAFQTTATLIVPPCVR